MGDLRKIEELTQDELKEYQRLFNGSQVLAAQLMIKMGVIQTFEEYCNEIAPVFRMMILGTLRVKGPDLEEVQREIQDLLKRAV